MGVRREAIALDDPLLLWLHDEAQPLARVSAGNLRLTETSRGLEFEAELPDTSLARDAVELVRSGVVRAMSFAFSMAGGKDRWESRDGERWRFISKVGRLFEISLVSSPAYAATNVQARLHASATFAEARATTATRGRLKVREPEAYYRGGPHSFFRDMANVQLAENLSTRAQMAGLTRRELLVEPFPDRTASGNQGGVAEARQRLATVEKRDVTAAGGAAGFVPASGSLPTYLGEVFSEAARAEAVIARELPRLPLPPTGLHVHVPRVATGAAVAVQATEADTATEASVDDESQAAAVAYALGMVDVSEQAWDRAGAPGFDEVLARDLGRALALEVDKQIMVGTNANGQTLGLLNTTNALSVTATDASPTAQEIIAKLWSAYMSISGSSGQGVSDLSRFAVIMHSRRLAFLYANAQDSQSIRPELPGRPIPSSAVRTTLGAGTDEDEAWLIVPDMLPTFQGEVRFLASEQLSGTLQVRFVARQPFASGHGRAPLSICRISGTAFKAFTL